jgi:hypothetical protein
MQSRKIYILLFCLLAFSGISTAGLTFASVSDSDPETGENVITAMDIGGGNITTSEAVVIIFAALGVFFLVLLLIASLS